MRKRLWKRSSERKSNAVNGYGYVHGTISARPGIWVCATRGHFNATCVHSMMTHRIRTLVWLYLNVREAKTNHNMEIVSIDTRLFDEMIRRVKSVEEKAVALCRSQEDLGLKKWLDNQEVCEILGISLRTLQTYREKGLLAYSCIKHKIFYKPEDVEALLKSSYHQQNRTK